jgi:glycosyltransferase involved in cell wall biosynthesis
MRCRAQEVELFRRCAAVLTLSEADASRAQALVPTTPAHEVVYKQADPETSPPPWSERDARTLLFVGDYGRKPNRRIAHRILIDLLPALRRRLPGLELILAGARMPKGLRNVARREGAQVPGYLPSLDGLYRRATLLLAPIDVGGGLHIKMVEAMTHGLPVLTTSTGNDGLGAEPGRSVWIADGDEALVEGCARLLGDGALAEGLGAAGREHVLTRFGAERARSVLESVLESVAG